MSVSFCVNTRVLQHQLTGVQRFVRCVLAHLPPAEQLCPSKRHAGPLAHIWEQVILPFQLHSRLLWSPVPSGPLTVRRQVVTVHDLVPLDNPEWLAPGFAAWYRFMIPQLLARSQHIIAISEFTKHRIVKRLNMDPDKISVVSNGVDKRFDPNTRYRVPEIATNLGLPSTHYILALGSVEPRKNLLRLLEAWQKVVAKLPRSLWLVIAGGAGKKNVFHPVEFSEVPDRVYWTGYVPDNYLPGLYAGADLFVYPSLYEGFGLPVLEAMASGCPVICSNAGALAEVAANAAQFIDPFDSNDIGQAIFMLSSNRTLCRKMQDHGLRQASRFSWATTAQQTLHILQTEASKSEC